MSRTIEHLIAGQATTDGAGVKLTRLLTHNLQRRLDPFLMLDAFGSDNPDDYIAGFPNHPHRGFETITYMRQGRMLHRDSEGNEGLLVGGGMQWMSAARGVIHSEIPQQQDGMLSGFQLWLNLAADKKMADPWYKDFEPEDLPKATLENGIELWVLAGESHGVEGAVQRPDTEPLVLDIKIPANRSFTQAIPASHNAFVVLYEGSAEIAGKAITPNQLAILTNEGEDLTIQSTSDSRVLIVAGRPLNEPIAQYGPFVMNTEEQIHQALADFRDGTLTQ